MANDVGEYVSVALLKYWVFGDVRGARNILMGGEQKVGDWNDSLEISVAWKSMFEDGSYKEQLKKGVEGVKREVEERKQIGILDALLDSFLWCSGCCREF